MKQIFKIILPISIAIIVIFGVAFYWFQWRPTQIRQRCFTEAEFDKRATNESNDIARREFINNYYDECLKRFGLEK